MNCFGGWSCADSLGGVGYFYCPRVVSNGGDFFVVDGSSKERSGDGFGYDLFVCGVSGGW